MAVFYGYPGLVWGAAYTSLNWLQTQVTNTTSPLAITSAAQTVFSTLRNACEAIEIYQAQQASIYAVNGLTQIDALPLTLSTLPQQFFANRYAAVIAFNVAITALVPPVTLLNLATNLAAGTPGVPYGGLLEFYMGYNLETPPTALSSSNFITYAAENVTAWGSVASNIATIQGSGLTQAYDAATAMYGAGGMVYKRLTDYTSGPLNYTGAYTIPQLWNQAVALPSVLNYFNTYTSSPQQAMNQQCGTIRYILDVFMFQVSVFLLSLRTNQVSQSKLADINQNDTLMDIAARSLANFEAWPSIAQLNGLQPPWIGPGSTAPVGQQVLLPTSVGQASGTLPVNYAQNILGVDYDFGPLLGAMPTWTGDYQMIQGLANFQRALGRRLQTTLGSLIYHTDFGSRIPPEVGAIQYSDTVGHIAAYGESALASDPRTASVISATAAAGPNFSIAFSGVVQPIGPFSTPVSVNQTLAAAPG